MHQSVLRELGSKWRICPGQPRGQKGALRSPTISVPRVEDTIIG